MKGRNPTAEERRWMARVRDCGCIACLNEGIETPPEYTLIHHIDGKTKEGAHFLTLPLCDGHHSPHYDTGLHHNLSEWQAIHGSQWELLEQVKGML